MASDRTRRLVKATKDVSKLGKALRARRRLQEEAIKLTRQKAVIEARLAEINEEEEIHAAAIDQAGAVVADASTGTPE